ncbi:MAG: T9SS type A sorting domain-containing protein [Bacteroidetes bacterium]|nr:T9SS type A sorting domain-containing protein [Bacteroidota bacterium]
MDHSYFLDPPPWVWTFGQAGGYHLFPDGTMWRLGYYTRHAWDEEGNEVLHQPGYGLLQALPNGLIDPDFDHKYTPQAFLRTILELPDGNFLITASNGLEYEGHPVGALFKIRPDSHLDTTFHTSITWAGGGSTIYHYPDGRMLVFGRFMAPEYPDDTLAVMRLLPDGSTDTTWPSIPFLAYGYFRGLAAVWDYLEIEPGKLIVVGDFNEIGGQTLGAITTIDTAGNVLWDYLPGTGAGFTQPLYGQTPGCSLMGIKKAPNGYIYIWGRFSGYNDGCGDHPEQRLLMRLFPLNVGVGEEAAAVPALSVYPNPADDRLHIAWDMPGKFSVLVEDLQGRTLLAHNLRSGDAPLDISMLSPGVYLLSVISETGTKAVAKWIKQ